MKNRISKKKGKEWKRRRKEWNDDYFLLVTFDGQSPSLNESFNFDNLRFVGQKMKHIT